MRHGVSGEDCEFVRIPENLSSETLSAVRNLESMGNITAWFETVVGVLRSCILSPLVFNVFIEEVEVVLARALKNLDIGVVISGHRLNNLLFADDIAAISDNNEGLKTVCERERKS